MQLGRTTGFLYLGSLKTSYCLTFIFCIYSSYMNSPQSLHAYNLTEWNAILLWEKRTYSVLFSRGTWMQKHSSPCGKLSTNIDWRSEPHLTDLWCIRWGCVSNMNHSFLMNICFPFLPPVLKCHFPRVWPFILQRVLEWNMKQTIVPRNRAISITRWAMDFSGGKLFYHFIAKYSSWRQNGSVPCKLEPSISCFTIQNVQK